MNKCNFDECNLKITLIGHCKFCNKNHCRIHRYTESHKCNNLMDVIQNEKLRLQNRLLSETCVNSKIQQF